MLESCLLNCSLLLAQADVPWFKSGFFVFGLLLASIAASIWLGYFFAKALRMPEQSSRLALIIGSILVSLLIFAYGELRYGVDLRGGVTYIGQMDVREVQNAAGKDTPIALDIIPKLMQRVDPSGTREIMIRPLGLTQIEVTIPDVDLAEADEIWNRLVKTGHLQFRIVADSQFHSSQIKHAMDKINAEDLGQNVSIASSDASGQKIIARWYNIARVEPNGPRVPNQILPFKYIPNSRQLVRDKESGEIIDMSQVPLSQIEELHGQELADYCKSRGFRNIQVLLIEPESEESDVEGSHLVSATAEFDEKGVPCVGFRLSSEGSSRMGRLTSQNRPRDGEYKLLAIVLDDYLHSAPRILEPIYRNGRITGNFTEMEVKDLCINLQSGKIDVALHKSPISKEFVKSTLGEELKNQGYWAAGISLAVILVFMLIYYKWFAGGISCLALLLNMVLIFAFVIAIKQPLTLTGIAGLVLTIGMSVDANVLIFERLREEISRGTALRLAIRNGFEKATTTIVDSNVTTIITAIVLYIVGTEQLKGFAVTLILGILMSMFTAVYCARTIFDIAERKHWITSLNMMQLFPGIKFDFLSKQFVAILASIILLSIGIVGMVILGSKILDIDLRGGSTARVIFNSETDKDEILSALNSKNVVVKDEAIVFVVSEMDDKKFPKRSFKIDSSLPTPEAGDDWKPLDLLIEDTFKGKLRQLKMNYDPNSIKVETVMPRTGSLGQVIPTPVQPSSSMKQSPWKTSSVAFVNSLITTSTLTNAMVTDYPKQSEQEKTSESGNVKDASKTEGEAEQKSEQKSDQAVGDPPLKSDEAQSKAGGDLPTVDKPKTIIDRKKFRSTVTISFDNPINAMAIRTHIGSAATRLDRAIDEDQITVRTESGEEVDDSQPGTVWNVTIESRNENDAKDLLEDFKKNFDDKIYFPATSGVGSQIALASQLWALGAIFASFLGIIVYVWIRFQSLAFGFAAVLALVHDVLAVLGAIAISNFVANYLGFLMIDNFKISLTVLAAILTVIGYSLNDTIVIFDRVREVRGKRIEMTSEMINTSLCQTLSRTILTSLTVFLVVVILYFFGGETIHAFAFSLVVGVISGTYSTIFIASPALLWFMNWFGDSQEAASTAAKSNA